MNKYITKRFLQQTIFIFLVLIVSNTAWSQRRGFGPTKTQGTPEEQDYLVTIHTSIGKIQLILFDDTPLHKTQFVQLIQKKAYDSALFHRVIDQFMVQGGLGANTKDVVSLNAEIKSNHLHKRGALAAARLPDNINPNKNSDPVQFYIVQNPQGTPFLNGNYTVFGQTISGMEVVDQIAKLPKDAQDKPLKDFKFSITVVMVPKAKIAEIFTLTQIYQN